MSEHVCPICEEEYESETAVRDHSWDGHGACQYCGETFEDRPALYEHWLEAHDDDLSADSRKRAENKVGDRTVCPVCNDRRASPEAVRNHSWDAHDACHLCGETFEAERELHLHWLGAHGDDLSRETRERAESSVGALSFGERLKHQGPVDAVAGVSVSRRALLKGGGAGLAVGVAGVVGGSLLGGGGGGGGSVVGDHPATSSLSSQPVLGATPGEGQGTIVAFEDPSCPSCRRFETGTFPRLKQNLVDSGKISFVFRNVPVVYPWGEPASLALEATLSRSEPAFWSLKDHYYQQQNAFSRSNVLERTRQFLADRTGVDAAAVVEDARKQTHQGAIDADLQAFQSAGGRGTPTFYLFRDGSFVTDVVGPQSYSVFANSLGV